MLEDLLAAKISLLVKDRGYNIVAGQDYYLDMTLAMQSFLIRAKGAPLYTSPHVWGTRRLRGPDRRLGNEENKVSMRHLYYYFPGKRRRSQRSR